MKSISLASVKALLRKNIKFILVVTSLVVLMGVAASQFSSYYHTRGSLEVRMAEGQNAMFAPYANDNLITYLTDAEFAPLVTKEVFAEIAKVKDPRVREFWADRFPSEKKFLKFLRGELPQAIKGGRTKYVQLEFLPVSLYFDGSNKWLFKCVSKVQGVCGAVMNAFSKGFRAHLEDFNMRQYERYIAVLDSEVQDIELDTKKIEKKYIQMQIKALKEVGLEAVNAEVPEKYFLANAVKCLKSRGMDSCERSVTSYQDYVHALRGRQAADSYEGQRLSKLYKSYSSKGFGLPSIWPTQELKFGRKDVCMVSLYVWVLVSAFCGLIFSLCVVFFRAGSV